MIEVAIVSMEQALEADGEAVPAGSGDFEQRPMTFDAPPSPPIPPASTGPPVPTDSPPGR